jgi:hypothetical protein
MRIIECPIIFLALYRIFNRQFQVKGIVINETSGRIRTNTKAAMKKIIVAFVFGCILLTIAWFLARKAASTPVPATSIPQPTATAIMLLPTPSSPGNSILWKDLQVTMDQPEFTEVYETDYGSSRFPPSGGKFLWVHIGLRNTGQVETAIPLAENFSVLYASTELKPTYGHRDGYKDYTTLTRFWTAGSDLTCLPPLSLAICFSSTCRKAHKWAPPIRHPTTHTRMISQLMFGILCRKSNLSTFPWLRLF